MSEIEDLKIGDKLELQEFRASRLAHVIALHDGRVGIKWFESGRWTYDRISRYRYRYSYREIMVNQSE